VTEPQPALGVYVHWPFCARICPYCDFNVYRARGVDEDRWRTALIRDLEAAARETGRRPLVSLYFGGGTPSLASAQTIAGLIAAAADLWGFDAGAEITLEANPADADPARLSSLRAAGVNRISLGVQSFDDAALKFLGRDHDGATARRALEAALGAFSRVSFDLIYALPDETPDAWRRSLREALGFGAEHLSLYQLTIEPGTAFARAVNRGRFHPPADDLAAALLETTAEETERAGLPAYEISNHARPGAQSRHNLLYWTGGDYVGVGPGAHGRLTRGGERIAVETHADPRAYLAAVETAGSGVAVSAVLDAEARLVETLAMGLRLTEGIPVTAVDFAQLGARAARLDRLVADGLVFRAEGRLAASPAGRRVLNTLLAGILA
jgi:putative oxygen-independent coproporphyrinogen III oxidase